MDITYFSLEDANFCLNFNLFRKNVTKQIQLQPVLSDPWQPQCVRLSLWNLLATFVLPGKYHQKYKQSYLNYTKVVSFWGNGVFWKRRRRLLYINTNVSLISKIEFEDTLMTSKVITPTSPIRLLAFATLSRAWGGCDTQANKLGLEPIISEFLSFHFDFCSICLLSQEWICPMYFMCLAVLFIL